eukprot:jgi/Ulvmu1/4090/UM019_0069.1
MGEGNGNGRMQKIQQLDQVDEQASDHCESIVTQILIDVDNCCEMDANLLRIKFNMIEKEYHQLPYKAMLDAIACGKSIEKSQQEAAAAPPGSPQRIPAATDCSEPRTLRARAGKLQVAPAPTPAVAALNQVGYNIAKVCTIKIEVALQDGTKQILSEEDFENMGPDNMRGTNLEHCLTESLRLQPMR